MPAQYLQHRTICPKSQLSSLLLGDLPSIPVLVAKTIVMADGELNDVFHSLQNILNPNARLIVYTESPALWRRELSTSRFNLVDGEFCNSIISQQAIVREIVEEPFGASVGGAGIIIVDSPNFVCKDTYASLLMNARSSTFTIFTHDIDIKIALRTTVGPFTRKRQYVRVVKDARVTTTLPRCDKFLGYSLSSMKGTDTDMMPPLEISCHVVKSGVRAALQDMIIHAPLISHKVAIFDGVDEGRPKLTSIMSKTDFGGSCAAIVTSDFVIGNRDPLELIRRCFHKQFPDLVDEKPIVIKFLKIETPAGDDNSFLISGVVRKLPSEWVMQTPV